MTMYNLNNIKKDAIHQLNKLCSTLNKTQLEIIAKVINRCETIQEVLDVKNLFIQKNKVFGSFDFDADDDNATLEIALLQKDLNLSYTLNRNKPNNTMIIGDNFDALKNLLITSYESIDVIYIDPPYNTGGSDLGYKDKFGKDAWLSLMYERLEYARQLLKDDGIIFVSIDDNMQAYLKIIMDEIFGEANFIANIKWKSKNKPSGNTKLNSFLIDTQCEYIMVYSKSAENLSLKGKIATEEELKRKKYIYKDEYYSERGYYKTIPLYHSNSGNSFKYNSSLDYPIEAPDGTIIKIWQNENKLNKDCYTWSKDSFILGKKLGFINFKKDSSDRWVVERKIYEKVIFDTKSKKVLQRDAFSSHEDFITNIIQDDGTKDFRNVLCDKNFYSPKPVQLIKHLINLINDKNITVLDFFSGSGTTAEAVLELNKEDNGNRKYIVCTIEQDQDLKVADICYERIYRINHGYGTKNEKNYAWLKNHEPYQSNLNVYKIIKENITLDQNNKKIEDFDFLPYKELNPDLDINKTNFLDELYSLTIRNWWLS